MTNKTKKLTFIDLFSGAGGLSIGLEQAGFVSLLGIDNDKPSIETYKKNHPHSATYLGDIRDLTISEIKNLIGNRNVDLICGGPPCQGFSTVGRNDPHDSRNHLFLEFVRIVKAFLPNYVIIENVTGLLSKRNNATMQSIINCFTELGYSVNVKVLSAHHYGVPEARRRTIILGNRHGVENIYPNIIFDDESHSSSNLLSPRTVGWAFKNLVYYSRNKAHNHNIEDAVIKNKLEYERIKNIPEGKGVRYEKDEIAYLSPNLRFDINWSEISEGRFRQTKLHRLDRNKPSNTINTSKNTYYHPTENRYLTPREAAAIQSFPPNFIFCGSLSQIWRQIGNAVPPLLAQKIGEAILELDRKKDKLDKSVYSNDLEDIRKSAFVYKNKRNYKVNKKENHKQKNLFL